MGASPTQTALPAILNATKYVNAPMCPVYPPDNCGGDVTSGGGMGGAGGQGGADNAGGGSSGGCTVGGEGDRPLTLGMLALGLWLAAGRRRRRAR